MVQSPPDGMPIVTPYLLYNDVDAMLDYCVGTLGFTERVRMPGPDGSTIHGEVVMGDGVVMMGRPGPDYQNPTARGGATSLTYVYVDDVDAHFAQAKSSGAKSSGAKSSGAKILNEPAEQFYGDRTYGVEDPEGHQWSFAQHTRDVTAEDMRP